MEPGVSPGGQPKHSLSLEQEGEAPSVPLPGAHPCCSESKPVLDTCRFQKVQCPRLPALPGSGLIAQTFTRLSCEAPRPLWSSAHGRALHSHFLFFFINIFLPTLSRFPVSAPTISPFQATEMDPHRLQQCECPRPHPSCQCWGGIFCGRWRLGVCEGLRGGWSRPGRKERVGQKGSWGGWTGTLPFTVQLFISYNIYNKAHPFSRIPF